tara:strand:- start:201 stop:1091 length:891 start_codon:yes stop_codon:yes gene_type:complete
MAINGVYAASMSLISSDEHSLDVKATIKHAENVVEKGINVAMLGSTSQAQLIGLSEKMHLIEKLAESKIKDSPILIGTGLNSVKDNIYLMKHSIKFGFDKFLVMNPAYFINTDPGVYAFYSNIIQQVPESKIILYNFSKLGAGYAFSQSIVEKLINEYGTEKFLGMKDSTKNLWNNLKIPNFSMFVGSELNLLEGLKLGCAGCISATLNVNFFARKVFDDFQNKKEQTVNKKMCEIRRAFDESGDLITALHSFMSIQNKNYERLLPPLVLLSREKQKELLEKLKKINFIPNKNIAA